MEVLTGPHAMPCLTPLLSILHASDLYASGFYHTDDLDGFKTHKFQQQQAEQSKVFISSAAEFTGNSQLITAQMQISVKIKPTATRNTRGFK